MMRRIASPTAVCAVVACVGGCASPASHLYTLTHAPPTADAQPPCNVSVIVGPVSIPSAVDVPQIVVSRGPNQVSLDEFNRWAAPLESNISRVVAENLIATLGTSRVSLFHQALPVEYDYRVAIEVQGFDSAPGEAATLSAMWSVRRIKDGKTQTGRTTDRELTPEKGYDALVAAHSRALARMSQEIADVIRAQGCSAP